MLHFLKYKWSSLSLIVLLFAIFQWAFNSFLHLENVSFEELSNYVYNNGVVSLLNTPFFWDSIWGSSIRLLLDIFIVASIIFFTDSILRKGFSWRVVFVAVIFAQLVFLVKFFAEFIYFKCYPSLLQNNNQQQFSLFSIDFFCNVVGIHVPFYFQYALQIMGSFEVLYWIVLSWLLSKFSNSTFKYCWRVVLTGYVPILLIWLLFITFLLYLKN